MAFRPRARRIVGDKKPWQVSRDKWARIWPWVLANALAGQTLGVTCMQWALKTTQAGIVTAIIATTPAGAAADDAHCGRRKNRAPSAIGCAHRRQRRDWPDFLACVINLLVAVLRGISPRMPRALQINERRTANRRRIARPRKISPPHLSLRGRGRAQMLLRANNLSLRGTF